MTTWATSAGTLRIGAHEIAVLNATVTVDECGEQRRAAALRTFRRAMRRHEKRARRMGLSLGLVWTLRAARAKPAMALESEGHYRRTALEIRRWQRAPQTWAWIYERLADAVAKLRGAS